jgi:hypothetical protein
LPLVLKTGVKAANSLMPLSNQASIELISFELPSSVPKGSAGVRATGGAVSLGGDIYIHGGCNSDGCLAVTDEGIMELYWMSVEARAAGQQRIPVHIFPARLEADELARLQRVFGEEPERGAFWATLKPGYEFFELNRRIPAVMVDGAGDYVVVGEAANASAQVAFLPGAGLAPGRRQAAAESNPQSTRPPPLGSRIQGN